MTSRLYTREEMVDAWTAGANGWHTSFDRHEQAQKEEDAERYVDRLQNPPPVPANAAPVDLIPENVSWPTWGDLAAVDVKFNEFALKTKEREVALCRMVVLLNKETMVNVAFREPPLNRPVFRTPEERFLEGSMEIAKLANTYFPELTEET